MDKHKIYRILIVENDEDIRTIEQVYLESNGFEVRVLCDGDRIKEILLAEKFDLILLGLMLPGKNGYEICKEIREQYTMPILMVTSKTESLVRICTLNIGADDCITIPFEPMELFETIWGLDYMGDSATVMVHINRIRDKIERDSRKPKIIVTVRGAGYRLNMESEK